MNLETTQSGNEVQMRRKVRYKNRDMYGNKRKSEWGLKVNDRLLRGEISG